MKASIISINWPLAAGPFWVSGGREGASIISISWPLGVRGLHSKHHQHQLAPSGCKGALKANIISISWPLAGRPRPFWQASSASAGPCWVSGGHEGEHHQHQLAPCWASAAALLASISSISWPWRRASSASIGPLLLAPSGCQGAVKARASSASVGPRASAAFMASIISISWPLLGVRGPRRSKDACCWNRSFESVWGALNNQSSLHFQKPTLKLATVFDSIGLRVWLFFSLWPQAAVALSTSSESSRSIPRTLSLGFRLPLRPDDRLQTRSVS